MASNLYYWIKLRTDFFDSDTIDFLMSQKNGADYVVLYQMLCLKTVNTDGGLYSEMGEVVVPYDVNKIDRITKYFGVDTVRVALELYKKLGLVYAQEDGILKIVGYKDMVGYETQWAEKKRVYREKVKTLNEDNVLEMSETTGDNVREEIEIRDRDKSIEIENIQKEISKEKVSSRKGAFVKPTIEEARAYIEEKSYRVNAEQWFAYYETNGWKVGKNPMKDWKASIRYWNSTGYSNSSRTNGRPTYEDIDHGHNPSIDRVSNGEEGDIW